MDAWHAVLLGIVEGLTEFVPVSSTGHLILLKKSLHLHGPGVDSFLVVVQLGALLAAVFYYRRVLWQLLTGLIRRDPAAWRLFLALCVASLPLLLLGYMGRHFIKSHLFSDHTVVISLFLGGVLMLLVNRLRPKLRAQDTFANMSWQKAACIGAVQTLALIPGTSRSMASMVGGQLAGLSQVQAADFAFLLAIPTLGVATVYELLKARAELMQQVGWQALCVGLVTSFVVGFLVMAGFLRLLRKVGLWPFALYRMGLAGVIWAVRFL